MNAKVVTANRLNDGDVVYLAASGAWAEALDAAAVAEDAAGEARLLEQAEADVAARQVVGPYAMPVARDGAALKPLSQREAIRARGPSVRLDLGKQAAKQAGAR